MEIGTSTDLTQFDRIRADIRIFTTPCLDVQIIDRDSADTAMDLLRQAASFRKRIEERRKEIVKPIKDEAAKVDHYAKTLIREVEPAETHLRAQLGAWEKRQAQERAEAAERLETERRAREEEARTKAMQAENKRPAYSNLFKSPQDRVRDQIEAEVQVEREVAQINAETDASKKAVEEMRVKGSRVVWKFEVTDPAAVPREFLCVDEKLIRAAVNGGARDIPGVRIYDDVQVTVR